MTRATRLRRRFLSGVATLAGCAVSRSSLALPKFRGLTSIEEFGCREGAGYDNALEFSLATTQALTLYVPEGNYYTSRPVLLSRPAARLVGAGAEASKITGILSNPAVIQIGDARVAPPHVSIEGLTVTRARGKPPNGSIGIHWASFNYGSEDNVIVDNQYYGRVITGPSLTALSIGYRGARVYARNCTRAYLKVSHAAGIYVSGDFGQNGGEYYDPKFLIEISGGANDLNFTDMSLIPQGPSANTPVTVGFINYENQTGVLSFLNCNTENVAHAMSTDQGSPVITALKVVGGRYAPRGDFFALADSTSLVSAEFTAVDVGASLTIAGEKWLRFGSGTFVGGNLSIHGNGNDLQVVGAVITGTASLSGNFKSVTWVGSPAEGGFKDTSVAAVKQFTASPPL